MDRTAGPEPCLHIPDTPLDLHLSLTPSISTLVSPIMTPAEEVPCASSPAMTFGDTLPEVTAPTELTINDHARILPPPEPPPCSIIDDLMRPPSTPMICVTQLDLCADQEVDSTLALLPYQIPSILDSITRIVCSSRVCGVRGDDMTSVKILRVAESNGKLIDGGSNVPKAV